jgi:phenylacetate-coenzyme A ligase PaaK-like adenylate-forming protein
VITTLTKQALPMLRYRTRDITRLDARALRVRAHARAHPARDRPQ